MDRQLIDYLPPVLQSVREMRALLISGEQPEAEALWSAIGRVFDDQYLLDAGAAGIARWEQLLGIRPRGTDSLDARRDRVLARLNESLPYTERTLRQMLDTLCGADAYTMLIDHGAYLLRIVLSLAIQERYADVLAMLGRVVPANMVIDLWLKYNTFAQLARLTHGELAAFTHAQLQSEVLPDA